MFIRPAFIRTMVTVWVMLFALASCDEVKGNVALSGPKRYKSEVSANLLEIKDEIEKNGQVSEPSYNKLSGILDRYKDEFGGKGSYHNLQEIKKHLDTGRENPSAAFQANQEAIIMVGRAQDVLMTEVQ